MEFLNHIPVWLLAVLIFGLRIVDVSLSTVRTILVVSGRVKLSVILGFFEVLIWIVVVSQVITRIHDSPFLPFAYAGGFAAGVGVGMLLEKRIGVGLALMRIISRAHGPAIAEAIRAEGQMVTRFEGEGRDGPVNMLYIACPRKRVRSLLALAQSLDPRLFYAVARANEWREDLADHHPTGLLSMLRGK